MSKDTVVIYGPFNFPFGDASSNRVFQLAKLVIASGRQPFVVGKGMLRPEDRRPDNMYVVDDIPYTSIYSEKESSIQKLRKILSGGISYEKVWSENSIKKPSAIISYGSRLTVSYAMTALASRIPSSLITDVAEWYSPEEFALGALSPHYIDNVLGVQSFRRYRNVIAISRLLENLYAQSVPNVIRIPPTVDTQKILFKTRPIRTQFKLIYAGSLGKKDYLHTVIQGIGLLNAEERSRIAFNIYGINQNQLQHYLDAAGYSDLGRSLGHMLTAHGRVSRDLVLEALQDSDFMVLLRPQLRYANAGFPSKVPESLAVGTPLMLNYTSDLALYIHDGREGLIVSECTPQAMADTLRRALALSWGELDTMRQYARQCAEQHFDYRIYVEPFKAFMSSIQ